MIAKTNIDFKALRVRAKNASIVTTLALFHEVICMHINSTLLSAFPIVENATAC